MAKLYEITNYGNTRSIYAAGETWEISKQQTITLDDREVSNAEEVAELFEALQFIDVKVTKIKCSKKKKKSKVKKKTRKKRSSVKSTRKTTVRKTKKKKVTTKKKNKKIKRRKVKRRLK